MPYPACLADRMAWRLARGLACSLDQIPRTLHVARFGSRLTDTRAQREFSVQQGMSEIDIARSIARIAQKIAEVGNSGGADESHLHIHAQRSGAADAPMSGDPLPARFDRHFQVRGDRIVTDQMEEWNTR